MTHSIVGLSPRHPMWVYEENFRLLHRLLPVLPDAGGRMMLASPAGGYDLEVEVIERCRYTTALSLKKPFAVDSVFLPDLVMRLRTYADAVCVEVTGYQGCERIPARYQVTGASPYLRDEKRQVNHLLHDLLRHCLRYGYRPVSDPDYTNA
jgi:uncharacterized protein YqiB (DUF1249 family)